MFMEKIPRRFPDGLLTRDEFRSFVFERDGDKCVLCGLPAQDAHHILERRLFPDGGYYMANGASVCGRCHILCEQTVVSVEKVREAAGITKPVLPPHLYHDQPYDKWGNPVLPNGTRVRGELFNDASVQKVLSEGGVLGLFTQYVKYPRTYHLPWSPGVGKDDRVMEDMDKLVSGEVVATIKMDGENTTMYRDHIHARSVDSGNHPSRNWVRSMHGAIAHEIPDGWRICGENLYAMHSIHYSGLPSYFQVFSVWNDKNVCLSWDETKEWAELLGLPVVPEFFRGSFADFKNKKVPAQWGGNECEGVVVRVTRAFEYGEFRQVVGKYVRFNHVQTHGHWMRQMITPNKLRT